MWNMLRGKRPGTEYDNNNSEASKLRSLANASAENCPFCRFRSETVGNALIKSNGGHIIISEFNGEVVKSVAAAKTQKRKKRKRKKRKRQAAQKFSSDEKKEQRLGTVKIQVTA